MSPLQIRQRKLRKTYKNQLMLSEWLVEVPVDMAEKWLLILCPEVSSDLIMSLMIATTCDGDYQVP